MNKIQLTVCFIFGILTGYIFGLIILPEHNFTARDRAMLNLQKTVDDNTQTITGLKKSCTEAMAMAVRKGR